MRGQRGERRREARRRTRSLLGAVVVVTAMLVPLVPAPAGGAYGRRPMSPTVSPTALSPTAMSPTAISPATPDYVSGFLSAAQPTRFTYPEPFLYDPAGRVVLLHGVNAVYKRRPYELFTAPGKPWNFDAHDAARIAGLGFDVVRLGILWQGIEPGTAGPNDPAICAKGAAHDPGQWNEAVAQRYLSRVAQTVDLLARYHVYTLLDMHQDVYATVFRGEGAPPWAVCTDGFPATHLPGRWSNSYALPALARAFHNFWTNDVVGDLQGEYDRAWGAVAARFAGDPWVAGYDPINEPFTTTLTSTTLTAIDVQLECFYSGRARPGLIGGRPADCPPGDPAGGVVPTILAADPRHLIFREPTIFASRGLPNNVGPMSFPNLVLNFHVYCSFRSGVTGNPYNLSACLNEADRSFLLRSAEKPTLASAEQPHGLPLFMSEFGATRSSRLIDGVTRAANEAIVGWTYWSWKYYGDPTGSSAEALVDERNVVQPTARALSQTYPLAIAGSPLLIDFNPVDGTFVLRYTADPRVTAPTLVYVPRRYYYPNGYCVGASAGSVRSRRGAGVVAVENPSVAETVEVTISRGACGARG